MRVTLDLAQLLRDGAISQVEHDRLLRLGVHAGGNALVNVLVGFGVFAVVGGIVALVPDTLVAAILGAALMAAGIAMSMSRRPDWSLLASICILLAALLGGAGLILLTQGFKSAYADAGTPVMSLDAAELLVAVLFAVCAVPARSAMLACLTVLLLFAVLGNTAGYEHAFYELEVRQPLLTVLVFSALALAAHAASRVVAPGYERLLTAVARTALFLVNLGFWVGSLWGNGTWGPLREIVIPDWAFSVVWAAALLAVGVWAGLAGRRWVLNLVAVFAGIHFYTQAFETLGYTPLTVLVGGLVLLGMALALWRFNRVPLPA